MHYTTVDAAFIEGQECQCINDAIIRGCRELSKEIGGLVELAGVSTLLVPGLAPKIFVTVMAKPYQPLVVATNVNQDVFERMKERR
jgi:hypothetical protein